MMFTVISLLSLLALSSSDLSEVVFNVQENVKQGFLVGKFTDKLINPDCIYIVLPLIFLQYFQFNTCIPSQENNFFQENTKFNSHFTDLGGDHSAESHHYLWSWYLDCWVWFRGWHLWLLWYLIAFNSLVFSIEQM